MRSHFSRTAAIFFNPETLLPFLIGSIFLAVLAPSWEAPRRPEGRRWDERRVNEGGSMPPSLTIIYRTHPTLPGFQRIASKHLPLLRHKRR
jgi:hypothetical protein